MLSLYQHQHHPALDYAPAPVRSRAHRAIRGAILTLFFVSAGVFAATWSWRIAKQFMYLHWQQQCMQYTAAPSTSMLQDGAPTSESLNAQAIFQRISAPHESAPVVFMHRRVRKDGQVRLVTVTQWGYEIQGLRGCAWTPAGVFPSTRINTPQGMILSGAHSVFAGQPDPFDGSHFTLAYESNGVRGTIDGWLMSNDTVKLEFRDGPLAQR